MTISCTDCIAAAPSFVDDLLSTAERERLLNHLQTCATCRTHLHHAFNRRGYLSCQDVVDLVSAYLDGSLPAHEQARFDQHLAICPPCAVYVEQMRQTIGTLETLTEESLPEDVKVRLLLAFRDWTRADPNIPASSEHP
jgi:anti-sigma factor RsiW